MKNKKYSCNSLFFENPKNWNQEQAYFLGWLMSDGHHSVIKHSISIRLQEKDKNILEVLRRIIGHSGPLIFLKREKINDFIKKTTKKYQSRWGLVIYDNEISNSLLKLKIDNYKTNNLEFPTYLNKDLIPHFLRSFYEGDGTVSYSMYENNKIMKFSLNLIGTKLFIVYLKEFLKRELNVESTILNDGRMKNGNITLRISGLLNALIFFNYTYKGSRFVLKRKFRKFLRLINYLRHKTNYFNQNQKNKVKVELDKAIVIATDIIQNTNIK